jgi:CBS-domain-containing membrane protein
MNTNTKISLGALLAIFGAIGFILGPSLGANVLPQPWSFIAGFLVGVMTGIGAALCVKGLLEQRQQK